MVVKRQCSFCAREIEPGTGTMFVKRDGTVFHFCSSSCRKQQLDLGRVGHRFKWTRAHALKVSADRATPAKPPAPSVAPKPAARARSAGAKGSAAPASAPEAVAAPTPVPEAVAAVEQAEAPSPPVEPVAETAAAAKKPRARRKPKSEPTLSE